jgi:hypothetical protein
LPKLDIERRACRQPANIVMPTWGLPLAPRHKLLRILRFRPGAAKWGQR